MRRVAAIAAVLSVAGCAATEGPLLRAVGGAGGTGDDAGPGPGDTRVMPGMSFQYQLVGDIDVDVDAELFIVDWFDAPDEVIDALHAQGKVVACYLSAGTYESFRDDAASFPETAIGEPLVEYPAERWLDVRDGAVRDLMAARLDVARDKGFDAVLPTSLSAYQSDNGFGLTAADQRAYTLWLAAQARERGLSPGMSGDYAQAADLVPAFDWAMHYRCLERGDCAVLAPAQQRGLPVFDVEYAGDLEALCSEAERLELSIILKRPALDAYRQACP